MFKQITFKWNTEVWNYCACQVVQAMAFMPQRPSFFNGLILCSVPIVQACMRDLRKDISSSLVCLYSNILRLTSNELSINGGMFLNNGADIPSWPKKWHININTFYFYDHLCTKYNRKKTKCGDAWDGKTTQIMNWCKGKERVNSTSSMNQTDVLVLSGQVLFFDKIRLSGGDGPHQPYLSTSECLLIWWAARHKQHFLK